MGQSNAAVRQWMGNPKRFADLFNATVFNGEQVIQPEELESADGEYYGAVEPPVRLIGSQCSGGIEPL